MREYVVGFESLGMGDVGRVGGKNASLGEMIRSLEGTGVRVPGGFATTADAFREFLAHEGLAERIHALLDRLDVEDVTALAQAGKLIRQWIVDTPFPKALERTVEEAFGKLEKSAGHALAVAVRSSATAEDLPEASFAGQQETFLNVRGIGNVLVAIKHVFASLYNDRAISAGIQRMVRSDIGTSGVMFTLDTESGFRDVVFITASYGLGETVVQGAVNPDEFYVFKPTLAQMRPAIVRRNRGGKAIKMIYSDDNSHGRSIKTVDVPVADRMRFCLTDAQVEELARHAVSIEQHYQRPMDIEWGLDGEDGGLYILQARPETVKSRAAGQEIERYEMKGSGPRLAQGRAIGQRIGAGRAKVIIGVEQIARVQPGDVLVTDMTDPDWEPIMKRAAAIVTNRGGRTCHAAIIARELGIPAVVGCGNATEAVPDGDEVTVSCAEGDTGTIYRGKLDFTVVRTQAGEMPKIPTKIMMNVGNPDRAFSFAMIPNEGVGLARLEFVINNMIGVHPKALLEFDRLPAELQASIREKMAGYPDPVGFYVEKLAEGIASIAAAFYPKPVIVRLSDFKSNEYANLLAGERYEPHEENPMIGFRGASRYVAESFRACFELECRAVRKVRDDMGLTNVEVMIPFARTVAEAAAVVKLLSDNGLKRGTNGLRVIMMCEIPSNALLADEFLEHFDGFSIGSNDLTQLTLGLDRDSALVAASFDERNAAVKKLLRMAIQACRKHNKYVGICGQGPSDHPDLAEWLLAEGIGSISLNPDTVIETWLRLGEQSAGAAASGGAGSR
ncbi:MAG: phosphoenolpyruvate synthase [Acidithiobacillales bacterium SM23_46]|nr:MAG: phosphoenolpyruvate synthase [Acidithiobacillales bacterium SM23_46]